MEEIIIQDSVVGYFDDLVLLLIKENYFTYIENANDYVDKIIDFIYYELPNAQHKETPKELLKHGKYYVKYNANKRTAWYVFFDKKGNRYVIEYITNNHVGKAAFIKGLK